MLMSRKTSGKFSLNPKSQTRHAERLWAAPSSQNKQPGENIQHIGALQILVRQASFCLKRVETPASGSPHADRSVKSRHVHKCRGFFQHTHSQPWKSWNPGNHSLFPGLSVCTLSCNDGVAHPEIPFIDSQFQPVSG